MVRRVALVKIEMWLEVNGEVCGVVVLQCIRSGEDNGVKNWW